MINTEVQKLLAYSIGTINFFLFHLQSRNYFIVTVVPLDLVANEPLHVNRVTPFGISCIKK